MDVAAIRRAASAARQALRNCVSAWIARIRLVAAQVCAALASKARLRCVSASMLEGAYADALRLGA